MSRNSRRAARSESRRKQNIVVATSYIVSIETERFYKKRRFFWTVSRRQTPEELLSWGDSPTQELAAVAANDEIEKLESGSTGGRVTSLKIPDRQDVRVL